MNKVSNELYDRILKITGEDRVRKDTFERRMYSHDLAPLPKMMEMGFKMMPDLVVRLKTSEEVSAIVKIATEESIPIVPRGGASWGLGGALPIQGGIVLDLTGMNKILEIDEENLVVTVESGITWHELYETLLRKGYLIGSYPSSALAATVGGWINTGGIGVGSYKYGSAIDQLVSMEVVLPTGKILNTQSMNAPNFSGYNLNRLFAGSEGTLGIITKASFKIYPAPEELRPISYGFPDMISLSKAISKISRSEILPLHIAFLDKNHFQFLKEIGKGEHAPDVGAMLNIALEGDKEVLDFEEKALDKMIATGKGEKMPEEISRHEWDERYYELRTKRAGPSAALVEAFIPVSKMANMLPDFYKLTKKMKLRVAITGMMGDRNSVLFMPYYLSDERKLIRNMLSLSFVKKLGDLAYKHDGRPAGLGLFFSGNVKKMYGKGSNTMYDIKTAMDPYDIMNPGKTLEGLTRFGVPIPPFAMNIGMSMMSGVKRILPKDKPKKVVS